MLLPLCVDLDGTLIKSDSLFESFIFLLKKNPFYFFSCLFWILQGGKAFLKQQIALRVEVDPTLLPYSKKFLSYLHGEKNKGRYLALVTAADHKIAKNIADHLGLFSEIIASDGQHNLKGKNKEAMLNSKFGIKQYCYAGNDKNDIPIFNSAYKSILVNPTWGMLRQSKKNNAIEAIFCEKKINIRTLLRLLRVHQYAKNLLVFLPLLVGHLFLNTSSIVNTCIAFLVFCLLASSAYLLNDLLDLEADRKHPTKQSRPFAAGDVSLSFGFFCVPLFLMLGCLGASFLSPSFFATAITYYLLTVAYSFFLKKKMLIDVFTLAALYTLRIIAGTFAAGVLLSPWLLCFSLFLFLSLAIVKRYAELAQLIKNNKFHTPGRDYTVADLTQLQLFGTTSGYLAVLVLGLYLNSNQVRLLYNTPMLLWFIDFIFLYWVSRIWMLATRGILHEDPVIFALKDKFSWSVVLLSFFIGLMATLY